VAERPGWWVRGRAAGASGLAGSAATILLVALVHTAAPPVPFLPESIAQSVVRAAPGGVATFFIERLGHWAIRLALAGTFAAFLVAGAAAGLLLPILVRRLFGNAPAAGATSFLPLWAVSVALYPSNPQSLSRWRAAPAILPIYLAGGLAAGWAYRRITAERGIRATDLSRRYVLRALWFGGVGVLVGMADLGRLFYRRPDPGLNVLRLRNLEPATPPSAASGDAAFEQIHGLTPRITSNGSFYVVDEEIIDPDIDPATWRLTVTGLVSRPLNLTYDQLLAFPAVERYQTLECISNDVGGDLISTARWEGVALPVVLERAGVRPGAVEVVFRCAGGYSDSLSIQQAMDERTLLAVGMNGRVLPRAHGFPTRVLSVGTYGMKNPKWVTGIEVMDRPYQGFWEQRGWNKLAIVKTESRIDVPPGGGTVHGPVAIAGIAFAGDRGISRVEVSTDGGRSWQAASLETMLSPYTWRRWLFGWDAQGSGQSGLLVRAYDGGGALQTLISSPPHPNGASGYDAITVRRRG
jgi:DMSO/TMAO reductase YedYZ molybdopterin-dependent catalytic subunit